MVYLGRYLSMFVPEEAFRERRKLTHSTFPGLPGYDALGLAFQGGKEWGIWYVVTGMRSMRSPTQAGRQGSWGEIALSAIPLTRLRRQQPEADMQANGPQARTPHPVQLPTMQSARAKVKFPFCRVRLRPVLYVSCASPRSLAIYKPLQTYSGSLFHLGNLP